MSFEERWGSLTVAEALELNKKSTTDVRGGFVNVVPLEDEEAVALADYLRATKIPFCHVANESRGNTRNAMIRGAKLKRMGQSRGVWDYEIFLPVKGVTKTVDAYQEIRIELKRQKGGTVSPEQKEWGRIYEKAGIPCRVCKGAGEAIEFINEVKKEMEGACINLKP